jgi:methylmalonyl-CoA/ethylmalonyl-CoA epimerase
MKALKLDHIGIAVKNIDEAVKVYQDLGLVPEGIEVVEQQNVKVCFLPIGDTEVELLESTTEDGPIARHIERRGEGVQHLAFRVDNIVDAIKHMEEKGYRMIDKEPRYGAGGAKIAFMHPKSTNGVLVELSER